jgi:leader peptidase (prepilin peptidase)/N-methyltransferase
MHPDRMSAAAPHPRRTTPIPATPRLRSASTIAATVALAGLVAALQPTLASAVLRAVLVLVLVPCALIDLEHRIIPNRITGPAALLALALGLGLSPGAESWQILWALAAGAFLGVAAFVYPAGMGMGDAKLVFVMGLFLGGPVFVALLIALLANVAVGLVLVARRGLRVARKTTLPFAPFLAAGGLCAALVGNALISAYLSLPH